MFWVLSFGFICDLEFMPSPKPQKEEEDKEEESAEIKPEDILLKWETTETHKADQVWQIGAIILISLAALFFAFKGNYFGVAIVIISLLLLIILPYQKEKKEIIISNKGILIDKELFPWDQLESFWIFESPLELYLKNNKGAISLLDIPIPEGKQLLSEEDTEQSGKNNRKKIKEEIEKFLPEEELERNFIDTVAKKLGL